MQLQHLIENCDDVVLKSFVCALLKSFVALLGLCFVVCDCVEELNQWHLKEELPFCSITICHLVDKFKPRKRTYLYFVKLLISCFK